MAGFKNIESIREAKIVITPQAQAILSKTKYSIEDFTDWCLANKGISFGGSNVIEYLERGVKE